MALLKVFSCLFIIVCGLIVNDNYGLAQSIQIPQLPGLDKKDEHRQLVNIAEPPWQIIGRVQTNAGQKCTGFLISPRIVVTAAHCLWIKKTQQFFAPQSVHFLLGYQRQQYKIASSVSKIIPSEQYRQLRLDKQANDIVSDRVYLILPKDILPVSKLISIATTFPSENTPVWLGGYEQDRKEILYADKDCIIKEKIYFSESSAKLFHTCQATYGSSGAPLFAKDSNGKWNIVGIQIAAFKDTAGGIASALVNSGFHP